MMISTDPASPFRERRKNPRYNANFPVHIVASDNLGLDKIMPATTVNISMCGLSLKTEFSAPVASLLFLDIPYKGTDSLLLAEVIWKIKQDDGWLYGLQISNWTYLDPVLSHDISSK